MADNDKSGIRFIILGFGFILLIFGVILSFYEMILSFTIPSTVGRDKFHIFLDIRTNLLV